jgi:hypothetical protein
MSKAGQRLIAAAKEAKAILDAELCKRDWHDWQFFGDGHLTDYGTLVVADGFQKCSRCGRVRRKAFVL